MVPQNENNKARNVKQWITGGNIYMLEEKITNGDLQKHEILTQSKTRYVDAMTWLSFMYLYGFLCDCVGTNIAFEQFFDNSIISILSEFFCLNEHILNNSSLICRLWQEYSTALTVELTNIK